MPITSRSMLRWTSLMFVIGLAALLVIVGATAWLMNQTSKYADAAVTARETRTAIVDLKSLVQDTESGQRGFLLTRKDIYLVPFEQAKQEIPGRLAKLRQYAEDDAATSGKLDDLAVQIDAKLAELTQTVQLANSGRATEALAIVDSDVGKRLMDKARRIFASLTEEMDTRFAESVAKQRSSANALQFVALIGAIVIVAVVGGATWIITNYTRALTLAQSEIEALNVGLEERIKERTTALSRANDEIQRFAYIVTHDLRAPLVNIMGFTSELETSIAPIQKLVSEAEALGVEAKEAKQSAVEDLPEAIEFIRSSTRKMDGLINAILKLSRDGRRELKAERIDLRELVESTLNAVQHQIADNGGETDVNIAIPSIISDRLSLELIFGNLIDNAVKYASPERPLKINVRAKSEIGNRVVIEIEDNGRGIADQDRDRVFDLFRRSGTQDVAGEGIGLAYVRSSVRSLGGDIVLSSRLGHGTVFMINLPERMNKTMETAEV